MLLPSPLNCQNANNTTMGSVGFSLFRVGLMRSWSRLPPTLSYPSVFNSQRSRISSTQTKRVEGKLGKTKAAESLMENQIQEKPRILCLHGFRTSAAILKELIGRWPQTLLDKVNFEFIDGPFPAQGKSDVEGIFDPPYYEWYQCNQDFTEYRNFEECMAYIEEYMIKHGPFDGLLGFSQGAMISAAVPGMQVQGVAFTKVPKVKFLILISGTKFAGYKLGQPKLAANAFSTPIQCPSLHIIGEMDFLRAGGTALLESFLKPVVIHHPKGHIIPRLDEKSLETMLAFIDKVQKTPPSHEEMMCSM